MIKAINIRKSYGHLEVLRGVNLEVKEAEVLSIVGASGAGKSSLLHILGSISHPDSGAVFINGIDIFSLDSNRLADFRNKNIGFVFQSHHLLPEFTALENVTLPALIAKESIKQSKIKASRLLEFLRLSDRANHKPSELSGGEQQRVAIARALINNPPLILADEPSGNLDSKNKGEVHKIFFDLREMYRHTVIIVTHDRELASMSDRTLEMRDGEILNNNNHP